MPICWDRWASVFLGEVIPILNIVKKWTVSIMVTTMIMGAEMSSAQSGSQTTHQADVPQFETDPAKGRDFREISVHPNGEELLFVECSRDLDPTGGCYVLRYHLAAKTLQRYALPAGHLYTTASFSPQGHYVVMSRVRKTDGGEEEIRQAYDNAEIVLMKTDGTEFRILPLAKGSKMAPIMSQDEARIAYWRATLRPPGSKTFSSHFDVWEVNLKTGQDQRYAGPFEFYERSRLQYLSQDDLMVGAFGSIAWLRKHNESSFVYEKKYNGSGVYEIHRGMTTLPEPILREVKYANVPSVDRAGNLYFKGERPGISLFRKNLQGEIKQWPWPLRYAPDEYGGGWYDLAPNPTGAYIAFVYEIKNTLTRDAKRGMGLLMTATSEWRILDIPALRSSNPISVNMDH